MQDNNLALIDITKAITKDTKPFRDLLGSQQQTILKYIKKHKLETKCLGLKWFNILDGLFHVEEFELDDNYCSGVHRLYKDFETFDDFYKYVNGLIYEESCYYGYIFSEDEIKQYGLDLKKINFDSFINETIDDYPFEKRDEKESDFSSISEEDIKKIQKWADKLSPISSLTKLHDAYFAFSKHCKIWDASEIFFSVLLNKYQKSIKNVLIKYVSNFDSRGISFTDILFTYGKEAAEMVIDKYNPDCSYTTKHRRIVEMEKTLEVFSSNDYILKRKGGYDSDLKMYIAINIYEYPNNRRYVVKRWFLDFASFSKYLDYKLDNIYLIGAPISKDSLEKCTIYDSTVLPAWDGFSSYRIEKKYYKDSFYVNQIWLDANGNVIKKYSHDFDYVFDYIHFLKNDLSSGDYLMCDNFERIASMPNVQLNDSSVRSLVANMIGIKQTPYKCNVKDYDLVLKNELMVVDQDLMKHNIVDDYSSAVSYVTDIHIPHRFKANHLSSYNDLEYLYRLIANNIVHESSSVVLIGGDVSERYEDYDELCKHIKQISNSYFFFALGNHELWLKNSDLDSIIERYRGIVSNYGMFLVHNNMYLITPDGVNEINSKELMEISECELRNRAREARLIIFGGIGFSGKNENFNANHAIYTDTINRQQEIDQSKMFDRLHNKVSNALFDKNVIVLTHMPLIDWSETGNYTKGFVYVNGHNHRNYYYDDGIKRIYSDNQIGYRQKEVHMKDIPVDNTFDWFADYKDGIYEITKNDYQMFYRGLMEKMNFNRDYAKIYLLKNDSNYMFLMENQNGKLNILNGGSVRNAHNHDIHYFYNYLSSYAKSVKMYLSKYDEFQKNVSKEIKRIGGSGSIHGSIVDIDFYNHLYLNPLDGTITPYYALSMVDKSVYENLLSLLNAKCPSIYDNYRKIIELDGNSNLPILKSSGTKISKKSIYEPSTEMYRVSRILKSLQFTTKYNIVRLWNDSFAGKPNEENGRLIVSSIINPEGEK